MSSKRVRVVVLRTSPDLCITISSYYDVSSCLCGLLRYVRECIVYMLHVGVVVAAVWEVSSRQTYVHILLRNVDVCYSLVDGYKLLHEWCPAFMEKYTHSSIVLVMARPAEDMS